MEENGVTTAKVFTEVIVVFVILIYSVRTGYVPYPLIDVFSSLGTRSIQVNERFAMRVEALYTAENSGLMIKTAPSV